MEKSEIFGLLEKLCPPAGVSGDEEDAAQAACAVLSQYGDAAFDKYTGNVIFRRSGWDESKPNVLLDAHIDEIGLIVTDVTAEGFLKVAACGGVDARVLAAQQVEILGTASGRKQRLTGFVATIAPHLQRDYSKALKVEQVLIDTGFTSKEKVLKLIALGDRVYIPNTPAVLLDGRVTSKALDDRAGCAALIAAVSMLQGQQLGCNVTITLTSQEEVGERGAKMAAYIAAADAAIEVDVSFADTPDESPEDCAKLGSGVMIGASPSLSRRMTRQMKAIAGELGIPYTIEVMGETTGTNADVIGVSEGGIPAVTLSIPIRYMHTPAEVAALEDIKNTALLISEYLKREYQV